MKQKILFILHLPPPIHGAAVMGEYISNSKIANEAFECEYINLTSATSLGNVGRFNFKKLFSFFNLLLQICKTVKRIKPNLVYITPNAKGMVVYKECIIVILLKILDCKKIIAHYHNRGGAGINRFFKNIKIILLSERLYCDFEKYVPRENLYICPNGIANIYDVLHNNSNIKPRVLFLSNLIEEKGVFVLLKACEILTQKGLSFECIFAGAETKEITAKNFETIENVKYIGTVYGKEKLDLLRNSDIFCFPTFYSKECFPLVLLEAMQHSMPIVTTNEGGITDIVENGKTGILVKKKDTSMLSNAIINLIKDTDLRKSMGKAGYEKYKNQFTLEIFEKNFAGILDSCLEAK